MALGIRIDHALDFARDSERPDPPGIPFAEQAQGFAELHSVVIDAALSSERAYKRASEFFWAMDSNRATEAEVGRASSLRIVDQAQKLKPTKAVRAIGGSEGPLSGR